MTCGGVLCVLTLRLRVGSRAAGQELSDEKLLVFEHGAYGSLRLNVISCPFSQEPMLLP
jgi:hypothetical protein